MSFAADAASEILSRWTQAEDNANGVEQTDRWPFALIKFRSCRSRRSCCSSLVRADRPSPVIRQQHRFFSPAMHPPLSRRADDLRQECAKHIARVVAIV